MFRMGLVLEEFRIRTRHCHRSRMDRLPRGFYVITDYGTEYIEGKLDASELEQKDE